MTRVWAFVQQKGGVGKSTLCINLAVLAEAEGERVAVVDLDPQSNTLLWSLQRPVDRPAVIDALPEKLPEIIAKAAGAGATLVLIDSPSKIDASALAAIRAADMVICPTLPDLLNLGSLKDTVVLLTAADKLPVAVGVVNNVDAAGAVVRVAYATEALEQIGLGVVAPVVIYHRPAFAAAIQRGKGVTETGPGGKAAEEIRELWAWLRKHAAELQPSTKRKSRRESRS